MTFLEFYNTILNDSCKSYAELPYPVKKVHFKKGELITNYSQIEPAVYFINKGIVELNIKSYMTEKVIDFFFENEMVAALTSFLTQKPSDVKVMALVDCELEMISFEALQEAYDNSFEANKLGRIVIEQAYIRKAKREKDFLSKTAEERYEDMFKTHAKYLSNPLCILNNASFDVVNISIKDKFIDVLNSCQRRYFR